jgi:hypothetical protein
MGSREDFIIQQAERLNYPIPDEILNRPFLQHGLELYMNGFFELCTTRSGSEFGVTPISYINIMQYCNYNEFDRELSDDFFYCIRALDSEYIEYHNKKSKDKTKGLGK